MIDRCFVCRKLIWPWQRWSVVPTRDERLSMMPHFPDTPVPRRPAHAGCHAEKTVRDRQLAYETENVDRLCAGMYPLPREVWENGRYERGMIRLRRRYRT